MPEREVQLKDTLPSEQNRKFVVLTMVGLVLYSLSPNLDTFTIVLARTHFGLSADDYSGKWFQSLQHIFQNPLHVNGRSYNVTDGQTGTRLHKSVLKGNITRSLIQKSPLHKSVTPASTETSGEVLNVAFLKVHKAASSTVQNIILRFGYERNLTFVLPKIRFGYWPNVISLRKTISRDMIVPPPPGKSYNLLCSHVLFNYEAFRDIMPNKTKIIGILRDPFSQFQSTLNYFRPFHIERIQSSDPVLTFLNSPSRYEPHILSGHSFTNNRMAYEFGFPSDFFMFRYRKGILTEVTKYVEMLKEQFDLVLITEYFEESLVLMKRLLNWQLKDVIFLNVNDFPFRRKYKLHSQHRILYKRLAFMDYPLYYAFRDIILRKIKEGGADLQGETLQLKKIQNAVYDFCYQEDQKSLKIEESKWNEAFTINKDICELMGLQELHFYEKLRKRQYPNEHLSLNLQKEYDRMMAFASRSFRNLT